ncbi:flagellar biosynthetic protein FlhB [Desulfitispora alkaliphila]|uniref:flagellar biosynthesis protein FlhB n=1 Tax=Desulfitispora alkaliphila TaxID=622674 RepID=UPI003D1A6836
MLKKIDLQLFSQEKTEKATPKKRRESRRKGQVARSQELNSAVVLFGTFLTLKFIMPYMFIQMQNYTNLIFSEMYRTEVNANNFYVMFLELAGLSIKMVAPVMATALILGMACSYVQVGFLLAADPLKIKPERLNPIKGFKRIFSKRSLVELAKSIFKITSVTLITFTTINAHIDILPGLSEMELMAVLQFLGYLIFTIAWKVGLVLLIIAAIDIVYQRYEHEKSIKMSKHDVKEEHKQTEGHPQIKSKFKEKQRQMAMNRMMQDVPKADVVITNPTHIAVALEYKEGMLAPVVVAKGQDKIAEKIKEIAKAEDVPIVEDKPLARTLNQTVEIGDPVPADLYQAVAEVLAFVYKLNNGTRHSRGGK